jgi:hypothetical protein
MRLALSCESHGCTLGEAPEAARLCFFYRKRVRVGVGAKADVQDFCAKVEALFSIFRAAAGVVGRPGGQRTGRGSDEG